MLPVGVWAAISTAYALKAGYWYHLATPVWYLTASLTLLRWKHLSRKFKECLR
jgi:hypothetical protein